MDGKNIPLRSDAARLLEDEIIATYDGLRKAQFMAGELLDGYFLKYSGSISRVDPKRETAIVFEFDVNRTRAEILFDLIETALDAATILNNDIDPKGDDPQ